MSRLFLLDLLALLLFAGAGLLSHGLSITLEGLARNVLPILFVWLLLAPFLGTYRRPTWANLLLLLTWALAFPAGLWLRQMVLGGGFGVGFFVFLGVAMAFGLLFLLLFRGLAKLLKFW
ncbi:DUF3054 family protein [Thermus caldilimi]|uniref:DUF3054 family protein n=1 Tax=Thermus caldilimi TaxID=2483360 RepID=UPI0010760A61|nr:DUF3054 family protein [Thermus caldilimi]